MIVKKKKKYKRKRKEKKKNPGNQNEAALWWEFVSALLLNTFFRKHASQTRTDGAFLQWMGKT